MENNKLFVIEWLLEHDKEVKNKEKFDQNDCFKFFHEMFGELEDIKEKPRNRFQTASNYDILIETAKQQGWKFSKIDGKKINEYKLANGNWTETIKLCFFFSIYIFNEDYRTIDFKLWKNDKMKFYGINALQSSLDLEMAEYLNAAEQKEKNRNKNSAICECGQILYAKSSIQNNKWRCPRCSRMNDVPSGFELETNDNVCLEGDVWPGSVDMVFISDVTGSMGSYISAVKRSIIDIASCVKNNANMPVRFALIEYTDHNETGSDGLVVKLTTDFTDDFNRMQNAVNQMHTRGGCDCEAATCGFHKINELQFEEGSTRFVIWMGDVPPHGYRTFSDSYPNGCPCGYDFIQEVEQLRKKNVSIYPVICRVEPQLRDLMRAVAQRTGGMFLCLENTKILGDVISAAIVNQVDFERMVSDFTELAERLIKSGRTNVEQAINEAVETGSRTLKFKKTSISNPFSQSLPSIPNIHLTATRLCDIKSQMSSLSFRDIPVSSSPQTYQTVLQNPDEEDKRKIKEIIRKIKGLN